MTIIKRQLMKQKFKENGWKLWVAMSPWIVQYRSIINIDINTRVRSLQLTSAKDCYASLNNEPKEKLYLL